jgi:3'-5' exoribonuclease
MTPTDATGEPLEKIFIIALPEGKEVTTYFSCSDKEVQTDKNGKSYLRLKLRDSSGELAAIHFDPSDEALNDLSAGDVVKVGGTFSVHAKYGRQFQIRRLRRLEPGEYDESTLIPVSPIPFAELRSRLEALVASIGDQRLRALVERALDDTREPGRTYMIVPAAVRNHHAYRYGLLEHSLVVAEVAASVAGQLPGVDRDLVVAGALLHDIGKTRAYSADPMAPGLTDDGRLEGEIVIGLEIVRDLTAEAPGVPAATLTGLRHIVAAHHGQIDKGSPVTPKTREAIVVHYCDDMTARIAAFDDVARAAGPADRWSGWSKMLDGMVFLGSGDELEEAAHREEPQVTDEDAAGDKADAFVESPFGFQPIGGIPASYVDDTADEDEPAEDEPAHDDSTADAIEPAGEPLDGEPLDDEPDDEDEPDEDEPLYDGPFGDGSGTEAAEDGGAPAGGGSDDEGQEFGRLFGDA